MITELQFYEIDEQWLGSESEDYAKDEEEKDVNAILKQQSLQDDQDKELSPMEAAL